MRSDFLASFSLTSQILCIQCLYHYRANYWSFICVQPMFVSIRKFIFFCNRFSLQKNYFSSPLMRIRFFFFFCSGSALFFSLIFGVPFFQFHCFFHHLPPHRIDNMVNQFCSVSVFLHHLFWGEFSILSIVFVMLHHLHYFQVTISQLLFR